MWWTNFSSYRDAKLTSFLSMSVIHPLFSLRGECWALFSKAMHLAMHLKIQWSVSVFLSPMIVQVDQFDQVGWFEPQWICRQFCAVLIFSSVLLALLTGLRILNKIVSIALIVYTYMTIYFVNNCYLQLSLWSSCIWFGGNKFLQRSRETST